MAGKPMKKGMTGKKPMKPMMSEKGMAAKHKAMKKKMGKGGY